MATTLMRFGAYSMDYDGELRVGRKPTLNDAALAGLWLAGVERHHQRWLGLWYLDIQQRFPEAFSQAIPDGMDDRTLAEYARVVTRVPHWEPDVPFTGHQAVAALDRPAQREILSKAREEGLTVAAIRQEVRRVSAQTIATGEATGRYRVAYLAPVYDKGTVRALCALDVAAHLEPDAAVFLWVDERYRDDVVAVYEAWGVRRVGTIIWDTQAHEGPSSYLSCHHRYLLWLVRGRCPPDVLSPMVQSVVSMRAPDPAVPPERFRELIDGLYTHGRKIELLARRQKRGNVWDFVGKKGAAA